MPKGIYKRKKKKIVKVTKPVGRHYDRVVMDDIVSTAHQPDYQYMYNHQCSVNKELENRIEKIKQEDQHKRYQIINDWMKSVATINDAIAHAIGDIGGGR